jgi:hypothetical protein
LAAAPSRLPSSCGSSTPSPRSTSPAGS